jgi:hypothetical protein
LTFSATTDNILDEESVPDRLSINKTTREVAIMLRNLTRFAHSPVVNVVVALLFAAFSFVGYHYRRTVLSNTVGRWSRSSHQHRLLDLQDSGLLVLVYRQCSDVVLLVPLDGICRCWQDCR